jgi:choice-of-anchor A domain-containing protein/uncharacterized repeat protein (TIGR01451 family)
MSSFRPGRLFRFLTASFRRPRAGTPFPTSSRREGGRPARSAPALELLENRTLLSGTGGALGVAGAFNIFVLGQVTQSYTDSEGRVAAAGDVRLTGYGIGSALPNSDGQRDDLVVGGRLTYDQGQVFNGNIVNGGTAVLQNVGLPNGTARQGAPVDFAAARTQLDALSAAFAGLAVNGAAADTYGTLRLAVADPKLDVFSLSASELASANGLNITAPAGATVLVNVSGTAAQMQYFGMTVSGTDQQHVLFNFVDATSLTMAGISVQGSVLAPCADVTFSNGNLEGTLVAGTLTGSGEFHNFPTLAQIPTQMPAPDVTVTKTADQPSVTAGQTAGFTVTIKNAGAGIATGVTLSDPLPAGPGKDISWVIDAGTGNPSDFAVTGTMGRQTLTLSGSFQTTLSDALAAGQWISVHITGVTTPNDATAAAPGLLLNTATVSAANEAPTLQNQRASATVTVQAARLVQAGDFATIGFWQNQNGQALIRQLNGGSGATALGNWLAVNFPHLFGASVDPSNPLERNLTNATNDAVARYYLTLFGSQGLNKTYAQVIAVALGAYATSSTLAGSTYARPYGFNVSAGGSGADVVNVGSNGLALGLPNNQTQTVLALLRAADKAAANKTLKANLGAANTIFSGINQTGDVSTAPPAQASGPPVVNRAVRNGPVGR